MAEDQGREALSTIHISVPRAAKARWVKASQARGQKLTDWIIERLEREEKEMDAAAHIAKTLASASAREGEGDTLPLPPNNLPALRSIPGAGIAGAAVLGYTVRKTTIRDCIGPDGRIRVPGDDGFRAAQEGRLGVAPMPAGWRFIEREAHKLYALVDGNPVLLEAPARRLGYARAIATGPQTLDMGEIEL